MSLTIFKASKYIANLKATIHATGKLGFTEATASALNLDANKYVTLASDEDDVLYLINDVEESEDAFKVMKAGKYFSLNTKVLFDYIGLDYVNNNIIFDMIRVDNNNPYGYKNIYKLNKRERPRKK